MYQIYMRKYTPSGLPIVTPAVLELKIAELTQEIQKNRKNHFGEELQRIQNENPLIATLIKSYIEDSLDPDKVLMATISVYQVLEGQLQAYKFIDSNSQS